MYVYVCVYVCVRVCVYVCVFGWMDGDVDTIHISILTELRPLQSFNVC